MLLHNTEWIGQTMGDIEGMLLVKNDLQRLHSSHQRAKFGNVLANSTNVIFPILQVTWAASIHGSYFQKKVVWLGQHLYLSPKLIKYREDHVLTPCGTSAPRGPHDRL